MNEKERTEKLKCLKKRLIKHWGEPKFPHYLSNEKAKELRFEDWGILEDVKKIAEMKREKTSQKGTEVILEEIKKRGFIKNKYDENMVATLSNESIKKLLNGNWTVAVNIDRLFENAIEPWKFELDPDKDNTALKERRYLFAPMNYEGKTYTVKLTVLDYKRPEDGKRIYSGKIIDHNLDKKNQGAGLNYRGSEESPYPYSARHPVGINIPQNTPKVKRKKR